MTETEKKLAHIESNIKNAQTDLLRKITKENRKNLQVMIQKLSEERILVLKRLEHEKEDEPPDK